MLEGLGQRSPGSLDGDGPGLNGGFHSLGDRHKLKGVDLLHCSSESTNSFMLNSITHNKTKHISTVHNHFYFLAHAVLIFKNVVH